MSWDSPESHACMRDQRLRMATPGEGGPDLRPISAVIAMSLMPNGEHRMIPASLAMPGHAPVASVRPLDANHLTCLAFLVPGFCILSAHTATTLTWPHLSAQQRDKSQDNPWAYLHLSVPINRRMVPPCAGGTAKTTPSDLALTLSCRYLPTHVPRNSCLDLVNLKLTCQEVHEYGPLFPHEATHGWSRLWETIQSDTQVRCTSRSARDGRA